MEYPTYPFKPRNIFKSKFKFLCKKCQHIFSLKHVNNVMEHGIVMNVE